MFIGISGEIPPFWLFGTHLETESIDHGADQFIFGL